MPTFNDAIAVLDRGKTRAKLASDLREAEATYRHLAGIIARGGRTPEREAAMRRWREAGERAALALGWKFRAA